jgi:hypothetical protein
MMGFASAQSILRAYARDTKENGGPGMKSFRDIPYLFLLTAGSAIFFGIPGLFNFFVALAVRHTAPVRYAWLYLPLMGVLICFVIGVFSLRSRGLGYSTTIHEFGAALGERPRPAGGRPRNALAEFSHINARSLRSSLFLYWAVVIPVWTAACYIFPSSTMAFVVTMAAFIVAHVIRIAQLKELADISLGFENYIRTAAISFCAVGLCVITFFFTSTKAAFSWQAFWLVAFLLVIISGFSVHADFATARLLRGSTDK